MQQKNQQTAIVIASYGNQCKIETTDNEILTAKSLKTAGKPLCGDHVLYKTEANNETVITDILPRNNTLSRLNNLNPKPKQIAANIDQMIIVISVDHDIKFGLIDRYLVAAMFSGFKPIIVLNKIDKINNEELDAIKQSMKMYSDIDIPMYFISAKMQSGIDTLLSVAANKTNIVVGQSGVGKSSIVNAILPEMPALTKEISDSTSKGKHTTTTAFLYHIPDNGQLIDSPGIREFGLWNINKKELAQGFKEIQKFSEQCKFRDCLHINEPGCAITKAVKAQQINPQRYNSYLSILETLE